MSIQTTSKDYIDEMIGMTEEPNEVESEKSEVSGFFSNCNIFVTGGSGFIGKLLLEKLLRYVFFIFINIYYFLFNLQLKM